MARGWESKSVEEQISARESETESMGKKRPSLVDIQKQTKRDGLLLARAHTLNALQASRDERYRAQLTRALEHLDAELAGIA